MWFEQILFSFVRIISRFSPIPFLVYHIFFSRDSCMRTMIYINIFRRYFQWNRSFDITWTTFTFTIIFVPLSRSAIHGFLFFCRTSSLVLLLLLLLLLQTCTFSSALPFRYMSCLSLSFISLNGSMLPFFAIHKMEIRISVKRSHACDSNDDCKTLCMAQRFRSTFSLESPKNEENQIHS